MGMHRSKDEKLAIINDFLNSQLSIRQYCVRKGIPLSTLSGWLRIYNASIVVDSNDDISPVPNFYNVTSLAKDNSDYNKKEISKNVKLNIKGITLEFDVSILRNVLEVFNDWFIFN